MLFQLLSVVFFVHFCRLANAWDVSVRLNPGCDTHLCEAYNIVYVRASNSSSSVHFLFAASKRIAPSILIIHSYVQSAHLSVNWSLLNSELKNPVEAFIVGGITQSYAVTLYDLVEYNDTTDTADLSQILYNSTEVIFHPFNQWVWDLTSSSLSPNSAPRELKDDEIFEVTYSGNHSDVVFSAGGHVDLKFMVSRSEQHNPAMPRIKFVPGLSLQFEISMVRLNTSLPRGRFGLRLGLISNDSVMPQDDFVYSSVQSINDEVTPGIFEMVNLRLGERANAANSTLGWASLPSWPAGFLQSRPVCYVSGDSREVKTSRNARLAKNRDAVKLWDQIRSVLYGTLPYLFYGSRIAPPVHGSDGPVYSNAVGLRIQNISFGTPDDGYYMASQFIVWTASFGLGEPPVDPLSPLLIGLLALSAVVVICSLLFGTLILLVLRRRNRIGQHEPLLSGESIDAVPT